MIKTVSAPSGAQPHETGVDDKERGGDDHDVAKRAVALPEVREPSATEVALHCLTHLPFKKWCRWCMAARAANLPHRSLPPYSRAIQLFVLDYCFIKHAEDPEFLTVLVGRIYPSRAMFACPAQKKGADSHVTARLASFFSAPAE